MLVSVSMILIYNTEFQYYDPSQLNLPEEMRSRAKEKAASKGGLWMPCIITMGNITELRASGYLPPQGVVKCRPLVGSEICSASQL